MWKGVEWSAVADKIKRAGAYVRSCVEEMRGVVVLQKCDRWMAMLMEDCHGKCSSCCS